MHAVYRNVVLALVVAPLSGCWLSPGEVTAVIAGDADTDADSDSDTDADVDVDVVVEPEQGVTGAAIVITGGPFGDDAEVRLGGARAAVQEIAEDEIAALVPVGDEGFFDVIVESSAGTGTATDAYFRWDDASGRTAAIGEVAWYDYVGTYWSDDPVDSGAAFLHFTQSSSMVGPDLYGPDGINDDCVLDWTPGLDVGTYPAFGPSLELVASNGTRLPFTYADDQWENTDFPASNWAGGAWRLEAEGTPGEWPALDVAEFVRTPDAYTVSQPAINSSVAPDVFPFLQPIVWSPAGFGDFMILDFTRYYGDYDENSERLTCLVHDTGSYTLNAGLYFDGWDPGHQITVVIGRGNVTEVELPSGGTVQVVGVRNVVGAGFQY